MCICANHKFVARSCAYPGVHPKLEKGENPRKNLEVSLCLEQTTTIQTTATRIHRIQTTHRIHRIHRMLTTAQRIIQRTAQTATTTAQRTAAATATTITTTNLLLLAKKERKCEHTRRSFLLFSDNIAGIERIRTETI